MGDCKYCGKPAGFWRNKHDVCEKKSLQKKRQQLEETRLLHYVADCVAEAIVVSSNDEELGQQLSNIESQQNIQLSERKDILACGWQKSVDLFLDENIIEESDEKKLTRFKDKYTLTYEDLDTNGAYTKLVKSLVVRDLANGIVSSRVRITDQMPVNLQKDEIVLWVFRNAEYYEDKTRREWVGRSQGISMRVTKGVYYRVGAFRGTPIERTERVHIDTGIVFVTNKNIYFIGANKSTRIPYKKIVSFQSFSDGVGIIRDAVNAKPQVFVTGDGWFTYNLLLNIPKV